MSQAHYTQCNRDAFSPSILKSMHKLRSDVFKDRLGWDVQCKDGQEIDYFDDLNPAYMLHSNYSNKVEGCCRILPTEGPYMLKDIFPQLLRGEELPVHPNIWEISRFAVNQDPKNKQIDSNVNEITMDILRQIYDFAIDNNIHRYVAVTSAAMERVLRIAGIPIQRFGDGKLTRIGKVLSVCIWVDINDQYKQVVYKPNNVRKAA